MTDQLAPKFRLIVNRPNGHGYLAIGDLRSLAQVEQVANDERGRIRRLAGWTPVFRVFSYGAGPLRGDVTHLVRGL